MDAFDAWCLAAVMLEQAAFSDLVSYKHRVRMHSAQSCNRLLTYFFAKVFQIAFEKSAEIAVVYDRLLRYAVQPPHSHLIVQASCPTRLGRS